MPLVYHMGPDERSGQRPLRVRNGPSVTPSGRSAVGGEADVIDRKADIDFRMSAFGGRTDVACQGLSGPFLAITGSSEVLLKTSKQTNCLEL